MDIDRARTFLEIVHTGNFLKAADRLHVTQTTVSARIRTLEEELGQRLFVRNRSGATLTAAGREFERFAQSFVQIWERARQQLSVPAGRTSMITLGAELSLWNPLMLDWLVWMKKEQPKIALRAHVGVPDQLLEQLRTGVLDIAVLYAPKLLPGFKIELVEEEQLVLVRSPPAEKRGEIDYVHVDWGSQPGVPRDYGSAFTGAGVAVNLGPLALGYILRVGGSGYFRRGAVAPHIASGELQKVGGAPEFTYPAYAIYAEAAEERDDVQHALRGLKQVER
ncbi:LysR family transcriptional regulator [Tianweitania sediminis]|uniref:LysR family transcriptional regulator n=1 Tax=Tianweitania sediminis TaxID=1502156 RepID=A0A8J7QZ96_9HYPH|nr:LysR family transcriptional regulator [Tianweitania sediminis]MBP0438047.1 LysR family transcriptional regulator [Tianweitania sediminis]